MQARIVSKKFDCDVRIIKNLIHVYVDPERDLVILQYYDENGERKQYSVNVSDKNITPCKIVFE